ncbi:hypothetical protein M2306_000718 [Myroides gitamensis]|uniref:Uncharacterized protein n=1 Tax=Myroides odoratus TaxID=256 RepID=A0A378RN98_MYROD|nr:hypothetical protein [Myroides odoratus]MCS4237951.1 hypothetical protein [Myroides odoratus]MDH6600024.1 hypothetical protein [Myroides gitamensis]QQU04735.1 hypothetical protein I6I89_05450 [Myroides odoratus]STZ27819.1 Uncharacterised protein [Myroides odoratus]
MRKFESFDKKNIELKKNSMLAVKGGTSTTGYIVAGYSENEYPSDDKGNIDYDKKPILVDFPDL